MILSTETQIKIEKILIDGGLITSDALENAKSLALQQDKPLLSYLIDNKLVDEEDLTRASATVVGTPYVNLSTATIPESALKLLSKQDAETYMAVPFGQMQGRLALAMIDPDNVQAVDYLSRKIGRPLSVFAASRASIEKVLAIYPTNVSADVSAAIQGVEASSESASKKKTKVDAKALQNLVQDAPITRALNAILDNAAAQRASDVHIEPREKELKVRFRVDGILQDTMTLPKSVEPALISRIKILSNLKIDEHRIPQDGQFQINADGREIDLRIAIAPVVHGEQVVIRLLDKSQQLLTLDALGFRGRSLRRITEGIHKPHGMTLSTGPTGSGKSTTLYAIIQAIKDISINIVTLEDPVEYKMDGINQIQVNPDVGLTFASGLRSILRQDPNVVMVGEIRDRETADLAVQAALTGHVVLSTLHTNSAAGVLPRLLDMAVEPFLIASTVNTVIGQRLVRQLCPVCKVKSDATPAEAKSIIESVSALLPPDAASVSKVEEDLGFKGLPLSTSKTFTLYRAKGCNSCMKGYKGRLGVYEVFAMSDALEKLLLSHATTNEVHKQATAEGMITMKQDGYLKALAGLTTLEEVARVASES